MKLKLWRVYNVYISKLRKGYIEDGQVIENVDEVIDKIAQGFYVYKIEKTSSSPQISRALQGVEFKSLNRTEPGLLLQMQAVGRMGISNELLIKSRQLSGTPIIDAETSWMFLNWKLEYDAEKAQEYYNSENLHIIKGLTDLSQTDLPWLGNIPPEALIELREQGALEEIRNILGNNIKELISTNPTNCFRTRDQILFNIDKSFDDHRKKLDELRAKKWKFAGHDIGSWIVMGGIEIGAALTGTPSWGIS